MENPTPNTNTGEPKQPDMIIKSAEDLPDAKERKLAEDANLADRARFAQSTKYNIYRGAREAIDQLDLNNASEAEITAAITEGLGGDATTKEIRNNHIALINEIHAELAHEKAKTIKDEAKIQTLLAQGNRMLDSAIQAGAWDEKNPRDNSVIRSRRQDFSF